MIKRLRLALAVSLIGGPMIWACGTTSREVYCWGSNGNGQLGDGTTNGSPTPVRVVQ